MIHSSTIIHPHAKLGAHGRAIEEGAVPAPHGEALLAVGVVHDAQGHDPVDLEGDGDGEEGHAVRVVGRAVEGIDDPAMGRRAGTGSAFFCKDGVVREAPTDALDDERLGLAVHLGDNVARAALVGDLAEGAEAPEKEAAGAPGGVHRDFEEGIGHVARSVAHARVDSRATLRDGVTFTVRRPEERRRR